MNDTLYIFLEAKSQGKFGKTVNVVRRNGKIFDFVLPGEVFRPFDVITNEPLDKVMAEISGY